MPRDVTATALRNGLPRGATFPSRLPPAPRHQVEPYHSSNRVTNHDNSDEDKEMTRRRRAIPGSEIGPWSITITFAHRSSSRSRHGSGPDGPSLPAS